jgi:hypothetical protein
MEVTKFDEDLLELKEFSERLEKFIEVEHDYVEGSLVVALSAKFGSGKTSFLRMWTDALNNKEESPIIVNLNAWESDYLGDPLFAIISALSNSLEKEGESTGELISAAKDFGWFATAVGSQIVAKFTGIDPVAAGKIAEEKKEARDGYGDGIPDSFSIFEGRKKAMEALKLAIQGYVESNTPKILFLVDELDRCRPDYAISYLETIKHIFNIQGAVFVLAADRKQLENSAKAAFGSNLDFEEYYRKFIHREVSLPEISDQGYSRLASSYVQYYLEREGERLCFMQLEHYRIQNITDLIAALKLTPRQIQEVFRTLGHVFSTTEDKRGSLYWCLAVGTILMAAVRIGAPEIFNLLGRQSLEPQKALDFLKGLLGEEHLDWWFILLLTGGGLKIKEGKEAEEIMKDVGLLKAEAKFDRPRELGQWYQGWGHSFGSRFTQIHEKIEQVSGWN